MRLSGVGASEVAAVVEVNPYHSALDVWMSKVGMPVAGPDEDRIMAGNFVEPAIRALYSKRTGRAVELSTTLRHPVKTFALATPDGIVDDGRGLEIKLVGSRMAHHWDEDTIPDYVHIQCAWNMCVTGRELWDVAALIGGTDFRIATVVRDIELEVTLMDEVEQFWTVNVLGKVAPPPRNVYAHRDYLRARYPGSTMTRCDAAPPEARDLALTLSDLRTQREHVVSAEKYIENKLCEIVAKGYGIEAEWGKFLWLSNAGATSWKGIAEELAGGSVPQTLIEKHRGNPYRVPRFYPKKDSKRTT